MRIQRDLFNLSPQRPSRHFNLCGQTITRIALLFAERWLMCDSGLKGTELGVAGFTTWPMVSPCQIVKKTKQNVFSVA